jgi:predicted PurR-regulated permease PerM
MPLLRAAVPCSGDIRNERKSLVSINSDRIASLAGFLFPYGSQLVAAGRGFLYRIVPEQSEHFLELAGTTIRAVSQGVIGVAIIQSLLAGIGFKLAGIPGAGLLAFVVMILTIVQIGAAIVLVPVIIWIWIDKDFTTALLLTVFLCVVGILDNILKPLVMGRGLTTPTLVILVGVIGGTLAHGIVGLFIGPIILSLAWELTVAWIRADRADATLPNELSNVDLNQRSLPQGSLSELHDK